MPTVLNRKRTAEEGQQLLRIVDHTAGGARNLAETFRRLYYRLYSNSSTSRAERLVENLATILLLKFSMDKAAAEEELKQFLAGKSTASSLLKEFLPRQLPKKTAASFAFSISDESIRQCMTDLAHLDLSIAPAHVLGEAFQALIGPRLRGDKGQFFTPKSLVKAMVRIVAPQPHESVLDPACGTGGFLGEAHVYQHEIAKAATEVTGRLSGIEKDPDLAQLATALLHVGTNGRAELLNANSLDPAEVMGAGLDASYRFVDSCLKQITENSKHIQSLLNRSDDAPPTSVPIQAKIVADEFPSIVKGYSWVKKTVENLVESKIDDAVAEHDDEHDHGVPAESQNNSYPTPKDRKRKAEIVATDFEVQLINVGSATVSVDAPEYYFVPVDNAWAAGRLRMHGVTMSWLDASTASGMNTMPARQYRVDSKTR